MSRVDQEERASNDLRSTRQRTPRRENRLI
jgi:hypothetical protein